MKIFKAYCVELDRVVNIIEASEAFFAQSEPRKRFSFLCSDEKCRKENTPNMTKIIGVNYDKLVEIDEIFRAKHFKNNPVSTAHINDCEWIERELANEEIKIELNQLDTESINSADIRRKGLKTTNAIQIFIPKRKKKDSSPQSAGSEQKQLTNTIDSRNERIKRYKREITDGISETSLLENLTDVYRSMTTEERLAEPLTIKGIGSETYYSFLMPIFSCRDIGKVRIYHGNASVRCYGKGFSLLFYEKINIAGKPHAVSLYLPADIIESGPKRLRIQLDESAKNGRYALCFFFGHIVLNETYPNRLNAEIEFPDHMVVYPITKKQQTVSGTAA